MAWRPWSTKSAPRPPEKKAAVLGLNDTLSNFLTFGQSRAATASSALFLYEQSTAVSVPINMVADAFAVLDIGVKVGEELVKEHPVLDLIRNPSPLHSQELFLEIMAKNFLITGENPVVALGTTTQPPQELHPISPKSITPSSGRDMDAPERWTISGRTVPGIYEADDEFRYFDGPLRELMVTRNFSTKDNSLLRGQSLLVSASKEARQHVLGTQHNVRLLENGGRVSLVFHFDADMDDELFEDTKERVREQYGGSSNAGLIGVTAGGKLDIKELGITPKDMDYGNLHSTAVKSVALTYKVPLPLVMEARQTLNNFREAKLALYDDAVIPLSRRILGGLTDFLMPRFGLDPAQAQLTFDPDSVTALVMRRNEELKKRKDINIESDNELRALIGREPYEGGEIFYKPANLIPAGTDLFTDDEDPDELEPTLGGTNGDD